MQAAFVKHDGFQCGYCTPGQICSAVGGARRDQGRHAQPRQRRPDRAPRGTAAEIRERMSGNICRCGAYSNIVDAITEVAGSRHEAFTYERAPRRPRPPPPRCATPGAKFIAGGTNLLDLMKLADRGAHAPDRRQRPRRSTRSSHARGRPAHRRAGAQHRPRRR
jgi:hypothetical protein